MFLEINERTNVELSAADRLFMLPHNSEAECPSPKVMALGLGLQGGGWSSDLQLSALPTHCAARAIAVGWMLPALPGAWQSSASSSWGRCPRKRPTTAKPSRGARPWIKRFYSFNPQQPMSRIWFITISFLLVLGPRSLKSREVKNLLKVVHPANSSGI